MKDNKYDIHERIFNFVVSVVILFEGLPKTSTNLIFINQGIRSSTSMGANDQEADGALTTKDFIHGFTIVRKECKETIFWLKMVERFNPKFSNETDLLIKEGSEIVAIVSTIITKSGKRLT